MAYVRLQGLEWQIRKHKLKILEVFRTGDGAIRLNCYDPNTRQYYYHFLTPQEKVLFDREMSNLENILFEKELIAFSEGD